MKDAELIERWTETMMKQLNEEIAKAGKQRKPFPASPFGRTPVGLVDFRGFTLREGIMRMELQDHDLYLMRCDWAGAFVDCKVKGSVLDKIKIDGRFVGTRFEGDSFRSASMSNSSLGGIFQFCDFSKANLSKAGGNGVRFIDCLFTEANLKQANLMRCYFERCTFDGAKFHNGSLAGSTFKDVDVTKVEWGNTIMDHVKFA
jgi:uncharacterized protein YjbI with pentapeptide repeats